MVREYESDLSGAVLVGGDQLWFGRGPGLTIRSRQPGGTKGRFRTKQKQILAAARAARPTTPHPADPAQLAIFDEPPRAWDRLDPGDEYALALDSQDLLHAFADYLRSHDVDPRRAGTGSLRTLRILLAHLGARAPLRERDVTAIAALSGHHNGRRVIHFLRDRELLEATPRRDAELTRARRLADSLPAPFDDSVHLWIDVLLGLGSRPSPALACATIYVYVVHIAPVLNGWAAEGITDLREIGSSHIATVLEETEAARRHSVHPPLRSLFRALRRERKIFRDPARRITLTTAPRLPAPLPSDTLKGLLTRVEDARSQLIIALVAIHVLAHEDLPRLLPDDRQPTHRRVTNSE
ncbi:hypothetical protein [Streptomyces sp. IBSBF 2806]|uniref:hypothetical protein n=1 Tax=Streptomyces sp. IBSBF 2806 TaxID=2903529 RepID=UPI002FDC4872